MAEKLSALLAGGARLLAGAGVGPARLEAEVLLAHVLATSRAGVLARLDDRLPEETVRGYRELVRRRAGGYPLQYLTGRQEFMSLEFVVTPDVLIPRADTESLVEACLRHASGALRAADVGTGSGAIAVSLARYLPPGSRVWATDTSPAALAVARENARRLGAAVDFRQGDLLEPLADRRGRLDLVVSNPPYIPTATLPWLPPEVRHEPREALDGGPDGLAVYRRLLPQAAGWLAPGGFLAVEVGDGQGGAVAALAEREGFREVRLLPDAGGRERVVLACWGNCS